MRPRLITALGVTKSLREWSEQSGIDRTTIAQRIDRWHWSPDRAVSTTRDPRRCPPLEVGQRFGRMVVAEVGVRVAGDLTHTYVACACDCGTARWLVRADALRNGLSRSCGCYRTELLDKHRRIGHPRAAVRT